MTTFHDWVISDLAIFQDWVFGMVFEHIGSHAGVDELHNFQSCIVSVEDFDHIPFQHLCFAVAENKGERVCDPNALQYLLPAVAGGNQQASDVLLEGNAYPRHGAVLAVFSFSF